MLLSWLLYAHVIPFNHVILCQPVDRDTMDSSTLLDSSTLESARRELIVLYTLVQYGQYSFAVSGPAIWNSLPVCSW